MSGDNHNQADPLDLDAIEARANAATPGPWDCADEHGNWPGATPAWCINEMRDGEWVGDLASLTQDEWDEPNAKFIAHAREDVPALIAEVRRLRVEREWVRAIAADYGEHPTATSRDEGCSCDACTKFPADFH